MLALASCSSTGGRQPPPPEVFRPQAPPAAALAPAPAVDDTPDSEITWALRGGLNVAALLCNDHSITVNYNQLLKQHRSLFNEAYAAQQARYARLHGSAGVSRYDAAITRLYNGFASIPDRRRFCLMAARISSDALGQSSEAFARSARRALTTLEPGALRLVESAR
ncbi:hypothetical protein CAP39_12840 [Sphingomonas sp. IBVSS1]|nr:hypothetical protein CAP39_12840 [Sphingomonas sp. IBVSS1]